MIKRTLFLVSVFLLFSFFSIADSCAKPLKIVAGTSLIEDIVLDLTDGQAEIITLIAGSSCPGHNDVKTSDFVFAAKADLALIHTFQQNMSQITDMMTSVNNTGIRLVIIKSGGSWLIPEVQKRAVRDIAAVLADAEPDMAQTVNARAEKRLLSIDQAETESLAKLAPLKNKKVVAATMQCEFLRWAGVDVVESYNRSEEMTPRDVAKLIDVTRGRRLAGVIDNYQSGADAGLPLALELKVPHLILSNFPGSSENVPDYLSLLRYNVNQLAQLAQ